MLAILRYMLVLVSLLMIMLAAFVVTMSLPGDIHMLTKDLEVCRTVCSRGVCRKNLHLESGLVVVTPRGS